MAECMLSGNDLTPDKLCVLSCQERPGDVCKSACAIPRMRNHCGLRMQPGSPCDAMRGYCDVFQVCRSIDPDGPLTRLQRFFFGGQAISTTIDYIADHPFWSAFALLGSAWFMVLVFRCFAVHTPSSNPHKKPPYKLKDTIKHPLNVFDFPSSRGCGHGSPRLLQAFVPRQGSSGSGPAPKWSAWTVATLSRSDVRTDVEGRSSTLRWHREDHNRTARRRRCRRK